MIRVTVRGKLLNPRDLAKEIRNSAEKALRRAAGPLVDLKRTKDAERALSLAREEQVTHKQRFHAIEVNDG